MTGDSAADDLPLDDDLARRLITAQFPALGPVQVTGRYGGMDHHAVEVDGVWIFRFPKRPECEPMLRRELKLLPAIVARLPVAVPRYKHVGSATADYPCAFAGYRKL